MKIIDNFLDKKTFNIIKETMINPNFPWFYQKQSTFGWDGVAQLTHVFYTIDYGNKNRVNSDMFTLMDPILKKLHAVGLIRVKANLTFPVTRSLSTRFFR